MCGGNTDRQLYIQTTTYFRFDFTNTIKGKEIPCTGMYMLIYKIYKKYKNGNYKKYSLGIHVKKVDVPAAIHTK